MMALQKNINILSSYHGNVRHDILHLLDPRPGRLLDLGGGLGATTAFAKANLGATGGVVVDVASASNSDGVDQHYQGSLEDELLWELIAAQEVPFDTILCLDVLEHLVDPWAVVRRCVEFLNPGGALIVSVPNLRHWQVTFPLLFAGRFDLQDYGILDRTHLRWFVRDTAIELVLQEGLKLEVCEGGWYMNRSRKHERLANFGIFPGLLFQNYILRARKI
ncbi:methyltransferase domain-containing protein [Amylibacter sp.]|nr:methyltransferase domain-containing protein [Amylibacter sp.]